MEAKEFFGYWVDIRVKRAFDRVIASNPGALDFAHLEIVRIAASGIIPEALAPLIGQMPIIGPLPIKVEPIDQTELGTRLEHIFLHSLSTGQPIQGPKRARLLADLIENSALKVGNDLLTMGFALPGYVALRRARIDRWINTPTSRLYSRAAEDEFATRDQLAEIVDKVAEKGPDLRTNEVRVLNRVTRHESADADILRQCYALDWRCESAVLRAAKVPVDVVQEAFDTGNREGAMGSPGATIAMLEAGVRGTPRERAAVMQNGITPPHIVFEGVKRSLANGDRLLLTGYFSEETQINLLTYQAMLGPGAAPDTRAFAAKRCPYFGILNGLVATDDDLYTLNNAVSNEHATAETFRIARERGIPNLTQCVDRVQARRQEASIAPQAQALPSATHCPAEQMVAEVFHSVRSGLRRRHANDVIDWSTLPRAMDRTKDRSSLAYLDHKNLVTKAGNEVFAGFGIEVRMRRVRSFRELNTHGRVLANCLAGARFEETFTSMDEFFIFERPESDSQGRQVFKLIGAVQFRNGAPDHGQWREAGVWSDDTRQAMLQFMSETRLLAHQQDQPGDHALHAGTIELSR